MLKAFMNKTINIFGLKYRLISLPFVFAAFFTLTSLGNWQGERAREKNELIRSIEYNIKAPPAITYGSTLRYTDNYSKIVVYGRFIPGTDVFLYGRRSAYPEKDGYYLLSSFKTDDNDIILVSRGWIPQSVKDNYEEYSVNTNKVRLVGFVLPGEKPSLITPSSSNKVEDIWFFIDLDKAKKRFNLTIDNFYLMQINSVDLPDGGLSLSGHNLSKIRNDHFEYMITWYSLAFILIIMFLIKGRMKNKT